MSIDVSLVAGIRALWEQGHFQDFTIQVEERSFRVHKLIMASVSDYFNAMLTGGMLETEKDTVQVGVVSAVAMAEIISFIYKDQMELTKENIAQVLDGAMYLQIPNAVKACVDFMVENINPKNCCSVLSIFKGYSLKDAVADVRSFIKSNVKSVFEDCEVSQVQYEELGILMDHWQGSEMELYLYLKDWVDADNENRETHFNDLLCKIRFCLMSPEELMSIENTQAYKTCPGSWHKLVQEAVEYHKLPLHARVLHDSDQSTLRSKPRLLCLYQDDDDDCGATLDEKKDWLKLDLSIPECYGMPVTSLGVNNFLLVSPNASGGEEWHIFDPRTTSWYELPPVIQYKERFAAVYLKGSLYVLGGSNSYEGGVMYLGIERYDFKTNQWSSFADLPDPREGHAACVFQDRIYMSGGQNVFGDCVDRVDFLDVDSLNWESKAPMLKVDADHFMCVMKIIGKESLMVVHEDFKFEYYDVLSNQWSTVFIPFAQCPTATAGCGVIAGGNTVYFVDEHEEGSWINDGHCLEVTISEENGRISVKRFSHFPAYMHESKYYFKTHGAVISLPDHKLPILTDESP